MDLISKIEYDFEKNEAIANLLFQMLLCQKLEECLYVLSSIDRIIDKLFCLLNVSKRLKKAGKKSLSYKLIKLSLSYDIEIMKDDIVNVSFALFEIGYFNKSIELINTYANEKSRADYWDKISIYILNSKGLIYWLNFQKQISEVETLKYYIKGISKEINLILINKRNFTRLTPLFKFDLDLNKKIIQSFVINQLFFDKQSDMSRYIQKFNIQWAIDIKNSLSEN